MAARLLIAILLVSSLAAAQDTPTPHQASPLTPATVPVAPKEVLPGSQPILLKDGERVLLRNKSTISTESAAVGDSLEFEVIKDVKAADYVIIPKGAVAKGTVASVTPKRRAGRGAQLIVSIDTVRLTTGEIAKLRSYDKHQGGSDMVSNMGNLVNLTRGLGLPLVPLFLLQHGQDVVVLPGTRFEAFVDGNLRLEVADVLAHQPGPPSLPPDKAVLYIYRPARDYRGYSYEEVTCGELAMGVFSGSNWMRTELPPGTYWLHAGSPADKVTTKRKVREFLRLEAHPSHTYYVRFMKHQKTGMPSIDKYVHLQLMPAAIGEAELAETYDAATFQLGAIKPEDLPKLQAQVDPSRDTKKK